MVKQAIRKWIRTHGLFTASVTLDDSTTVHKTWTKSNALGWMWLHSRKHSTQQFSQVTNVFGQRIAGRYYR